MRKSACASADEFNGKDCLGPEYADAHFPICRPRGGHNASPTTPPAETEDARRLAPLIRPPPLDSGPRSMQSNDSVSPRTTTRPASPDSHPAKRMKLGCFKHYVPAGASPRSPAAPIPPIVDPERSWQEQRALPRIHEGVLPRYWQRDEYVPNPLYREQDRSSLSSASHNAPFPYRDVGVSYVQY